MKFPAKVCRDDANNPRILNASAVSQVKKTRKNVESESAEDTLPWNITIRQQIHTIYSAFYTDAPRGQEPFPTN